jgi:hypothetical protein
MRLARFFAALRARLRLPVGKQVLRQLPRRSAKPRIGAYAVHVRQELRLMIQAGMSDELWQWLIDQGCRVETHRPDRRTYRDIPASYVTRLIDAHPAHREQLMAEATANAQSKRTLLRSRY